MKDLKCMPLQNVILTDSYFENSFKKEVNYLLGFDTDRLLAGFRETAGIDMKGAKRYPGWENMLIGGHTLGHYLTAVVQAYQSGTIDTADRRTLLDKLEELINGLKECQDALGNGFIFGAVILDGDIYKQFTNIEHGLTNIITEAWVPWYTMHKIIAGLVSVAGMNEDASKAYKAAAAGASKTENPALSYQDMCVRIADISIADRDEPEDEKAKLQSVVNTALLVVSRLADWTYRKTCEWDDKLHHDILCIEYGGMNDCLYDVYALTGKREHLDAAHAFDQTDLFERITSANVGDNILDGHHANTTIPKFMGALKRYLVTGDEKYLHYAQKFWSMVVANHSYITGGNSEWEHFGFDNVLDRERTNCNCETCNTYNMLKITKTLFMLTGEGKYADWYENTFLNSIMASQNPETGMSMYFQPMSSGYFKTYGEGFTKFWCCTGSGMENFSKLGESFYYCADNAFVIASYISSTVNYKGNKIAVSANLPLCDTVTVTATKDLHEDLYLRLPDWLLGRAEIAINNHPVDYEIVGESLHTTVANCIKESGVRGFALIKGGLCADYTLTIKLPMEVRAYNLPDGINTFAFKYGPFVLSALLGTDDMKVQTTGVDVTIPSQSVFPKRCLETESETVCVSKGSVGEFMSDINSHFEMCTTDTDKPIWHLKNVDANLDYTIHMSQHRERYGMYLKFTDRLSLAKSDGNGDLLEKLRAEHRIMDTVQPGYGQYECDSLHNMTEIGAGSVGQTAQNTSRYAKKNGGFSYRMIVDIDGCDLLATFSNNDFSKTLLIKAGNCVVADVELNVVHDEALYYARFRIPKEALAKAYEVSHDGREIYVLDFVFMGKDGKESAALFDFLYTVRHD